MRSGTRRPSPQRGPRLVRDHPGLAVAGGPRPSLDGVGPSTGPVAGGVLLWLEQRLEGVPYRRVAMTSVAFDEELDDTLCVFPDGADAAPKVRPGPRRPPAPHPRHGPPDGVLIEPVGGSTVLARTDSVVAVAVRP